VTTKAQTAQQKKAFLAAFAALGIVSTAARSAGADRRAVYRWLEHDEAFTLEYRQAELDACDVLVHAAVKRAVQGVPHETRQYDRQGKLIDTNLETRYSDSLLMFLIKKRDPSYRETYKHEHSGPAGEPIRQQHEVRTIDYDAFAAAFRGAASLPAHDGDDLPESLDTAHADGEAGRLPGPAGR
jgi:hypothetical protein